MAANDNGSPTCFEAVLVHGPNKYNIKIPFSEESEMTVNAFADKVFDLTGVPNERQKLICKGKSLTKMDQTMEEAGVKSGSKIMLIGKKYDPVEEKHLVAITKIDKYVESLLNKLEDIRKDFESLKQGYLDKSKTMEATNKLERTLKLTTEDLMKQIENLDFMLLDSTFQESRSQRKKLIQKIQKILSDGDKFEEEVKELKSKIEAET